MGKSKRKRTRNRHQNPTGIVSVKEAEEQNIKDEEEGICCLKNNTTNMLLEKMKNVDYRERECACATLSTITKNSSGCEKIVSVELLKVLSSLLMDANLSVQETAAGALHNITTSCATTNIEVLLKADILTPLCMQLCLYAEPSDENLTKTSKIILQELYVLWNMCESSNTSIGFVQRSNLIPGLLHFVSKKELYSEIAITSAQVLNVLSEDGEHKCFVPAHLLLMENILKNDDESVDNLFLKTLISSTIYNLHHLLSVEERRNSVKILLQIFLSSLSVDARELVSQASLAVETSLKIDDNDDMLRNSEEKRKLSLSDDAVIDTSFHKATNLLSAQQLALESITNICCPEESSNDCDMDEDSISCGTSSSDEDAVQDKLSELMGPLSISCEVHSTLINENAPRKILDKTQFLPAPLYTCHVNNKEYKNLIYRYSIVQSRALTCVQNMLAVLDLSSMGNKDVLIHVFSTFIDLLAVAKESPLSSEIEEEFYEGLTGSMRALMQVFIARKIHEIPQQSVLKQLKDLAISCKGDVVKVNVISLFGKVGIALARKKLSQEVTDQMAEMGNFLLDVAQTISNGDCSLTVVGEAIDSLLDMFSSGKPADVASKQILLAERLKSIEPIFKNKVSSCMDLPPEDLGVLDNIQLNLNRFIKYLHKRQNKTRKTK